MFNYSKRRSPSPLPLTLAEVIRREPRVADLISRAHEVGRCPKNRDCVCGNGLFQTRFKGLIGSLVGGHRQPDEVVNCYLSFNIEEPKSPSSWGVELVLQQREVALISQASKNRPLADQVLDSSEVYELVHRMVWDLMPDCRNCGCLPLPAPEDFAPSGARYVTM